MRFLQIIPILPILMLITLVTNIAAAEGGQNAKVNLVIAGRPDAPIDSYQEWSRELGKVGLRNVRIRSALSSDKLDIQTRSDGRDKIYEVTGSIEGGGDLLLPGARFSQGDAAGVARWVKDLAANGPPQSREPRGPFGLTESRFKKVLADLSRTVDFSTVGETRAAALQKIGEKLAFPLKIEAGLKASLAQDKITDELTGFSAGTALACVLRPLGLGFAPRETDGRELIYEILPLESGAEADKTWPVGWEPQGRRQKVLPELFAFHTISIQNVTLAKVLEAVGKKLDSPLLVDRGALARRKIDPEKIDVSLPAGRTTYGLALNRVLSKSLLKFELLVDEAGRPFIWVTSLKKP